MKLRDLVDQPELGLTLLHGDDRLDHPIESVFTTDLLDPRRYISGTPLVLSGLMWRRGPGDSEAFVRALAEAGVVALAAGEAAFGEIPGDVIDACRQHDVALIRVPVDVSFGRITAFVAADHDAERERALTTALGRQRRLLTAIADGRSIDELLALVNQEVGVTCWLLTPTGRHVAASADPLDTAAVDQLTSSFLVADRLPVAVELGNGSVASIIAVDSRLDHRLTAWFLVCAGDHREWPDDVRLALGELAAVIALEHRRWDERRRSDQRIADEIVALVASGQSASEAVAVRIADLGANPRGPCRVVTVECPDAPDLAHSVLHDAALQVDDHPITGVRGTLAVSILTHEHPDGADLLRAALDRLASGVSRGRVLAGLSALVAPDAMSGALDEAVHAVGLAALRNGGVSVVTSDEITSHVLLLGTVPDDVRQAFATRVLGPVISYDAEHGSDLLHTLEAFLHANCSWSRCADAIHVHVNTVRYRIQRVEELTGRDLSVLDDQVDVLLALRSSR
jgi:DNA-binding PucR family transcriptional regulator